MQQLHSGGWASFTDGFPHVEAVQRLGAICASPGQLHQSGQPVGNVDELPVLHTLLFQQGARHEAHASNASLPKAPFSSSKGPVVAARQSLPSIICREDEHRVVPEPTAF